MDRRRGLRQDDVWTPNLSPDPVPEHQPTGAAIWTGEWVGYLGSNPTIATGPATITVTLGTGATGADLTLEDVPTLGTLARDDRRVIGGQFTGSTSATNSHTYDATGRFGGVDQTGAIGHASGSDFRSLFYGSTNEFPARHAHDDSLPGRREHGASSPDRAKAARSQSLQRPLVNAGPRPGRRPRGGDGADNPDAASAFGPARALHLGHDVARALVAGSVGLDPDLLVDPPGLARHFVQVADRESR